MEALPFFRGGVGARNDKLNLARQWGYKNNYIIKTAYEDGIAFYTAESLEPTSLDNWQ